MIRLLFTISLISITSFVSSQCISGDCENGFGKFQFSDGTIYEGTFMNKIPNGLGIAIYKNGNSYFGQFVNSKFEGDGFLQMPDGQKFIGQWENSLQNGEGIFTDAKGVSTAGNWENGVFKLAKSTEKNIKNPSDCEGNCFDGYGRLTDHRNTFQAIFRNGEATYGRIFNRAEYSYDGQIEKNLPNGYGQITYTNGENYFGYFKNGMKHGKGILFGNNKQTVYGNWADDIYINFDLDRFCGEIEGLASTIPSEFLTAVISQESENLTLGKILDRKFLGLYEIYIRTIIGSFFSISYETNVIIPINKETIHNVSLQQINTALESCKYLTNLEYSKFIYKEFNNSIETYGNNSEITISIKYK